MSLKLSDTSVIFESDGKTVLVCDSFEFNELIVTGDSNSTLPVSYIRDYFGYTQGSNNGYAIGGFGGSPFYNDDISKFPIANDGNETNIGDLALTDYGGIAGSYAKQYGFMSGGFGPSYYRNYIQYFPFAADVVGVATDVADLTVARAPVAGHSSSTHGYTSGGSTSSASADMTNIIDKFSFSSTSNATDVGDITVARRGAAGHESTSHGYASGGQFGPADPQSNVIDKFPFSSDANATDVGDLTQTRGGVSGQSSFTAGYASGGQTDGTGTGPKNTIEKFPFSADGNSSDVADLSYARRGGAGVSSTSHGFTAGGYTGLTYNQAIDKFNFASDTDATLTGYLITGKEQSAGVQS